jgi:outer membrane protein assembly factor BamB
MKRNLLVTVAALGILAGCAGPASLDTGEPLVGADRPRPPAVWERDVGRAVEFAPVPAAGAWLVPATDNVLWRIRRRDGEVLWRRKLPGSPTASPVVCDSMVVVATDVPSERVVGIALEDGEERWKRPFGLGLPAGRDTLLVVASREGQVARLDPASGEPLWRARLPGAGWRTPALRAGRHLVLVPVRPDSVVALRLADGRPAWSAAVGPWPRVSAGEGPVVVAADDSTLSVLDPADGSLSARRALGSMTAGRPVVRGDTVAVALRNGTLLLLELPSLAVIWFRELEPPLVAAPCFHEGTLLQPGARGIVYGFAAAAGTPIGRWYHPERILASPDLESGLLVIAGERGTVAAYRRAS